MALLKSLYLVEYDLQGMNINLPGDEKSPTRYAIFIRVNQKGGGTLIHTKGDISRPGGLEFDAITTSMHTFSYKKAKTKLLGGVASIDTIVEDLRKVHTPERQLIYNQYSRRYVRCRFEGRLFEVYLIRNLNLLLGTITGGSVKRCELWPYLVYLLQYLKK
jgi:hypothetical protein